MTFAQPAADTALVTQVAHSSLAFDLETKAVLDAGAGIPHAAGRRLDRRSGMPHPAVSASWLHLPPQAAEARGGRMARCFRRR